MTLTDDGLRDMPQLPTMGVCSYASPGRLVAFRNTVRDGRRVAMTFAKRSMTRRVLRLSTRTRPSSMLWPAQVRPMCGWTNRRCRIRPAV